MVNTNIEEFYSYSNNVMQLLLDKKELSLYNWTSKYMSKFLVFLCANFFENEMSEVLTSFVNANSTNGLVSKLLHKVMEGKYYTYFDWEAHNANRFFSYFGETFKKEATETIRQDSELDEAVRAFLEIGRTRNQLAHDRFEAVIIPKTMDEYFYLFQRGQKFIKYMEEKLSV